MYRHVYLGYKPSGFSSCLFAHVARFSISARADTDVGSGPAVRGHFKSEYSRAVS
jgi:hypothetical protein